MKNKPYLIFVEGQDRVGKTTIVPKIFNCRNKIDNVFDRGPMSNMVYNEIFNRNYEFEKYLELFTKNMIIIYLVADEEVIKERTIKTNDYQVPLNDILKHSKIFEKYYELLLKKDINICKIDTSFNDIENVCEKAIEYINNI